MHIKYVEEEIEIRIESIKTELDKLHEKFKNDLQLVKNDLMRYRRKNTKNCKPKWFV